jgi:hypothetical protein
MRNFLFSVFAIAVASVAAMTATTALLNSPHRPAAVAENAALAVDAPQGTVPESKPATSQDGTPPTPGGTPDGAAKPSTSGSDGKPGATAEDDEGDKDPYEGVPEEELPPDMQYSADSSVSFPTNI